MVVEFQEKKEQDDDEEKEDLMRGMLSRSPSRQHGLIDK